MWNQAGRWLQDRAQEVAAKAQEVAAKAEEVGGIRVHVCVCLPPVCPCVYVGLDGDHPPVPSRPDPTPVALEHPPTRYPNPIFSSSGAARAAGAESGGARQDAHPGALAFFAFLAKGPTYIVTLLLVPNPSEPNQPNQPTTPPEHRRRLLQNLRAGGVVPRAADAHHGPAGGDGLPRPLGRRGAPDRGAVPGMNVCCVF